MNGIIALDIDGTVTAEAHSIPEEVVSYLQKLEKENWTFLFLTGRTFQWAYSSLESLDMPYYLAVQNGAILLKMPEREIVKSCYLKISLIPQMSEICRALNTDFIIYSGFENQDICYYRPNKFSMEHLNYLKARTAALKENWKEVETFDQLGIEAIASLKFIEKEPAIQRIIEEVEKKLQLHIPLNRDPFDEQYFVAQATHPEATKGNALKAFSKMFEYNGPIIAAGDDYNDVSMLEQADIKIVMGNAPGPLLLMADIIAPPVDKMGIINGLQHAIHMR